MTAATIHRRGTMSFVHGLTSADVKALVARYSYAVEGAEYSDTFTKGRWDGFRRLVKVRGDSGAVFPSGLEPEIGRWLAKRTYTVEWVDELPQWPPEASWGWAGPTLRGYQEGAAQRVLAARGGIVRLPIRAGKTMTAAEIIRVVGRRALFVVTSELLMHQAYEVFSKVLVGPTVGRLGAGIREKGDVLVATIQTISMMDKETLKDFQRGYALVIVDEVHHLGAGTGTEWRDTLLGFAADMRVGLSATIPDIRPDQPADSAWIWLRAICGGVVATLTIDQLVEAGFLMRPHVSFLRYSGGEVEINDARELPRALVGCGPRNLRIVEEAARRAGEGQKVLIDCSRVGHSRALAALLKGRLGARKVGLLLGASSTSDRQRVLESFCSEKGVSVVVGTVMGEGLDLPPLEVVINAEGGRGDIPLMQRMRNLTLCEGKARADVIDLWDEICPEALGWSRDRLNFYRSHPSFRVDSPEEAA